MEIKTALCSYCGKNISAGESRYIIKAEEQYCSKTCLEVAEPFPYLLWKVFYGSR